ncbi:hypothetical protein COU74_02345 [Candidatus Peregrinibacteria bacterium CG10_big_fil_rev_8_21_14_0_10_36_19]|nr:MAG: hypothetical protein COU74_02345 [Candidatus Peregrinibacteria bacterium CG10_big_fil_rev_8_21_14_0_10_36_19]
MNLAIFSLLKKTSYLFVALGVTFLMFDLAYYVMTTLPGSRNEMCVIGAGFTTLNIVFSVVMSFLSALLTVGILEVGMSKRSVSTSGLGVLLGSLTVFCTACTLPVISLFGFSLSLLFFTTYADILKVVSMVLIFIALYIVNGQVQNKCNICVN